MRIEAVRIRRVSGIMAAGPNFWEERLCRPIDVYDEFRGQARLAEFGDILDDQRTRLHQFFVIIETDEGVSGLSGPHRAPAAHIVASQLRPILLGRDPLAAEYLWDVMHRLLVHGRQGEAMHAISAVDLALWDLKGKWLGQPIWRVLGGSTRTTMPVYASMLGFAVLDPGAVRERAQAFKEKGFKAQKWFFRHGPMSGHEGLAKNVELVRTLRQTLGDDYDIMLDCWQSFDVRYVMQLAERIEEYRPYWIEETVMPDRIDSYRRLREKIRIPLAGAEHHYTRWGMMEFLTKGALDIYQPDPFWCGGLSETIKIATLTSAFDVICIPHNHSTHANIHISALQSPIMTPYQEHLVKWNEINQFFFAETLQAVNGSVGLPTAPGLFPALDPAKIETSDEL